MTKRLLLGLEDIHYKIGARELFQGVNLHVSEGDKICLIGRNGAGKTTLMRLITGQILPDEGKAFRLPGCTIGYLAQQVDFIADETVRQFVMRGMAHKPDDQELGYRADIVLGPLGLAPDALMGHLSGGQLRRAALAQALIDEPDILLLDEPTNHLDLEAIQWLEEFLRNSRSAIITVSHDRTFLSNFTSTVFWLEQGVVRICPDGYKGFEDWAAVLLEQEARTLHNLNRKLEGEIDWTQGGVSGRRKRNQRRMNELHRLRQKIRDDKAAYNNKTRKIELDPLATTAGSKIVAEFKQVSKTFERNGSKIPILNDFSLRILRGDRIGILGPNGSGKSTFLKLLIDELEADTGFIYRSKKTQLAYFDQHRTALDPDNSLWKTLAPNGDYVFMNGDLERPRHVVAYLKSFMFDPKLARDSVGTLSGGMQNRLLLARTLINPGNLMILDEPTNDLDMDTLDMLQEILAAYEGTLIIVSHDRDFLDRTVTEVMAFEGNAVIESHIGGYSDYLAVKTKRLAEAKPKQFVAPPLPKATPKPEPVATKRSSKELRELAALPEKVAKLEATLAGLQIIMHDPTLYTRDAELFEKTARELETTQKALDAAFERWMALEEQG